MRVDPDVLASCSAIATGLRAGDFSATDIVAGVLARVEDVNGVVNAICTPTADRARAQARACDERIASGAPLRPLDGVPFTVKDVIQTEGVLTTYGSPLFRDERGTVDAAAVSRLLAAGAILVGKSNTPEFASDPLCNTYNSVFGLTRNPWDVNRTVGASSGGAAAGLAARLAPLALGTDLGGSIRGPASFCGVVGLRPTPGRVSDWPEETAWNFPVAQVIGPMALSVDDVARAFAVLAEPAGENPARPPRRIAFTTDYGGALPVVPEVADAVRRAAGHFDSLGYTVEEACPDISLVPSIVTATRGAGMLLRYGHLLDRRDVADGMRATLERAAAGHLGTFAEAERARQAYARGVRSFLDRYRLFITPTWASTAYRIDVPLEPQLGERDLATYLRSVLYTYAVSLVGLPAISVPCTLDRFGLPVGVQLIGRAGADEDLLAAAAAFESVRGEFPRPLDVSEQVVRPMDAMYRRDGSASGSGSLLEP